MRARPRVRAAVAIVSVLILASSSGAARAGDPPDAPADASKAATAQALFDDGVKLMEAGRYGEACPKLAASETLDPGAGTLLDLGTCYEKNGQTASAWATFEEAESTARAAGHRDWADHAHARIVALEPRLQRLVIAVAPESAAIPGLKVTRDGVDVAPSAWGVAIPLDPGAHAIRATAPGKTDWTTSVEIQPEGEGSLSSVSIPALRDVPTPPPPAVSAPAPAPLPPPFWTTQRIVATALAGAGVVVIGIGSGLGLLAKSKYDDARANDCPGHGTACTAAGVQEGQDAYGTATASTAMFIGGAAAVAVGAVLFVVPLSSEPPASAQGRAAIRVAPSVAPGHVGVSVLGAW